MHEVFLAEDYERDHLLQFNADRENERLDKFAATSGAFAAEDGWRQGTVELAMPKEGVSHVSEEAAPKMTVSNVYYRPLLEVIKAAYQDSMAEGFHWFPFRLFRQHRGPEVLQPDTLDDSERMYSEIYNSDAMLIEDDRIQTKARVDREAGDTPDMEYAVAPILLYSDSTHLTSFGTAALWPIYVFFGNLSKYIRARPNSFAAHHLAYIPSVRLHPLMIQLSADIRFPPSFQLRFRRHTKQLMANLLLPLCSGSASATSCRQFGYCSLMMSLCTPMSTAFSSNVVMGLHVVSFPAS